MAAGTAVGGWRIIKTLGHKMVQLHPIHGFAAETTAATVITVASSLGIPVSTTHVISTAIMGVGATKRFTPSSGGGRAHALGLDPDHTSRRRDGLRPIQTPPGAGLGLSRYATPDTTHREAPAAVR